VGEPSPLIRPRHLAAYLSYASLGVTDEDSNVTELYERLATEIQLQTGEEFPISQRNDASRGVDAEARIEETLNAATLMIPVITPAFFHSSACRGEIERFLERERALGRADLILPVYYVSTPELDDPVRREADELAQVLASRQYVDWRELRFEPWTSPASRKALANLAGIIQRILWGRPQRIAAVDPGSMAEAALSTPTSSTVRNRVFVKLQPQRPEAFGSASDSFEAARTRGATDCMGRYDNSGRRQVEGRDKRSDRILPRRHSSDKRRFHGLRFHSGK
jgi:TIR domain